MVGFVGELEYVMTEPFFVDATDEEDARFKAIEALKEDFPEASSVTVVSIDEVKKK
jgi:hypothetical protein